MQCLKRDASSFHVDASINLYYIASSKCFIQGDEASLWFCCVAIDEFVSRVSALQWTVVLMSKT